ncbi:MAG: hypothetical protein Q4C46_07500 [Bacillota bacterium]|nr:hypothetical protein [Bacillota bacterium]
MNAQSEKNMKRSLNHANRYIFRGKAWYNGFYRKFGFVERPNDEMGAGMVRWINP